MTKINIVGDTHDLPALSKILSKLNNVISLGDIAAVNTQEYLHNVSRYSKVWRAYAVGNLRDVTKEDIKWFYDINVDGWQDQLEMIKTANKNLTVVRGNSDFRMLNLFPEMREILEEVKKNTPTFKFIEQVMSSP